jgi:hypothetical protein
VDGNIEAGKAPGPTALKPELPTRGPYEKGSSKTHVTYFGISQKCLGSLSEQHTASPPKRPDDPMTKVVKRDLRTVIQSWRRFQSTRSRDAVYDFLQQVYEIGVRWNQRGQIRERCRAALSLREHSPPMYPEAFGVLIVCAGQTDAKARSRWSRVLRVAQAHKAKSIRAFAHRHRGLNEIAAMFKDLGD